MNRFVTHKRLGLLRLSMAIVWLLFLLWLPLADFLVPAGAWWTLAGYLPVLALTLWQVRSSGMHQDLLLASLLAEAQLFTLLLYFTGGATNPLISYFMVLMVVAAYSLKGWKVGVVAMLLVVDYSLLTQWHLPLATSMHTGDALFDWHLAGMWLTFVISTLIIAVIVPVLMRDRHLHQQEIQDLRERQLKNEQLIGIATLAAGTAHEMGTPLMTLGMLLDELELQNGNADAEDVAMMQTQVERCRQSLQQLAMAGRHAYQHSEHDAGEWLNRQLHRWRLSKPQALWEAVEEHGQAQIAASPLLDQALLNLLDNAAEAGDRPVRLCCRTTETHWELDIIQPDPQASAHIDDEALFASAKEHGLGIGMYLSNASIEQFGGTLHLQAQEDGSSVCHLVLPRRKEGSQQ